MSISLSAFGKTEDGRVATLYTLTNKSGASISLCDFGARVVSICVPDRDGKLADVCIGFDDVARYAAKGGPSVGASIGRVGNRIGGARFTLNGIEYRVPANDGVNSLHGGEGFHTRWWMAECHEGDEADMVNFHYVSADGEEGYPGKMDVEVTYAWTDKNEMCITYHAVSDEDTLCNLTNHAYFNLSGEENVLDHELQINASLITATDEGLIPTGEELDAGVQGMRSWWDVTEGRWLDEKDENAGSEIMAGAALAARMGWHAGDTVHLIGSHGEMDVTVTGVYDAGGDEDEQIYAILDLVQALTDRENKVASIEVSALTTPDNELARRAARNPAALSSRDYETWYCTAYVSAICYQIQEVITGSVASAVRQVAESEGTILDKTKLLMILITALSLIGSALGISNLVTASVMERSQEIGLLKAIGARDHSITGVVMTEILITALIGFAAGYFLGFGFAQLIGQSVFGSAIDMNPKVVPIVAGLIALVTVAGSLPAIRMVLRLRPAEVLHGGH